jgi:anaerobic magnesium-protoporphyrin IX monomethyl ester cyclase
MSKAKILLINPSGHSLGALHLGYVAALLDKEGIAYYVLDSYQPLLLKELRRLMLQEKFDILLFISSLMNPCLNAIGESLSEDMSRICKEINPDCLILKDGIAATMYTDELLTSGAADIAVIGESDFSFIDVIKCLLNRGDLSKISGIAYLNEDQPITTPPRKILTDLDRLPFPARNRLNKERFREKWHYVIASRGCPFSCSICQPVSRHLFGSQVRYRNPAKVAQEIELILRDYQVNKLQLWGDTFTVNRGWVLDFCGEIQSRNIQFSWLVGTRADCIDLELATKMKQAGCVEIGYGIEAADEYLRNKILKKHLPTKAIYNAVRINKQLKITTRLAFLVGLPTDSIRRTLTNLIGNAKIILQTRPEWILLSNTSPIPGTELYNHFSSRAALSAGDKWQIMVGSYAHSRFRNVAVARIRLEYIILVGCWLLSNPWNLIKVFSGRLSRFCKAASSSRRA